MDGGSLESIRPYELPDMMVKARPSPDAIDGWQVSVVAKKVHAANRIVTEFMLAANEAIAMHGDTHGVLMPFCCQEMDKVLEADIEVTPKDWRFMPFFRKSYYLFATRLFDQI